MKKVFLVKYGEIAIRGKNRYVFEDRLIEVIKARIKELGIFRVIKEQGRFIIIPPEQYDEDELLKRTSKIFGIVAICPCIQFKDQSIENLQNQAFLYLKEMVGSRKFTFKIETKRADKRYPMDSREVSSHIGAYILQHMENTSVDVHHPEVILYVELRTSTYLYAKAISGPSGLPRGTTGKAILLLSGGIDSPVAGWMTAKRGVEVEAVYFHSPPYTSDRVKEKVLELGKKLSEFTGNFTIRIVPFTDLQLFLYEKVPQEKLTIFMKRVMLKIAEKIAYQEKAHGIITGDSIGQVASQNMQSLHAISTAVQLPIIRPLVGFNKEEIISMAKKIDTYETSILPYEDCCTTFVAQHPDLKPKAHIIEKMEIRLSILDEMINQALENTETYSV